MNGKIKYEFSGKPWQYNSKGGWVFVSLPQKMAKEIRNSFKSEEEGWGRLRAVVRISNIEWRTAIWFDTKMDTYLLPLKAEIRKKGNINTEKKVDVIIWL